MTPAEFISALRAKGHTVEDSVEREVVVRFVHAATSAQVIDPMTSISLMLYLAAWDRSACPCGVHDEPASGPKS